MIDKPSHFAIETLNVISYILVLFICALIFWIVSIYFIDKYQKKSSLRRNHPVLARFRYFFENLGVFFRQYFFSDDREEMPFNRAERAWVYRAAKNVDSTVPFGSTLNIKEPGTVFFVNSAFPVQEHDAIEPTKVIIGPYCKHPYETSSLINISAMSYGAISIPAVRALSSGAKAANIWINTGEGGLSPYHLEGGADIVFQIGTAKFGVRKINGDLDETKLQEIASLNQVKMIEIKLSQGAKPGKGGILPGVKVNEEIAKIRGIEIGKDAISPNRHYDIANIKDLLKSINHIRDIAQKPVGFKIAVGSFEFFQELCKEILEQGIEKAPDFITIDSANGGTGAAPMSLIDSVGLPIKESLPVVVNILKKFNLKDRIKICASGKLINPSEVAWALCTGADFVNSARGFMLALGCIQALQCNKNTCPTGIATHNLKLQYGLDPENKAERVKNYALHMVKELEIIAHACGVREPRSLQRKHARMVVDVNISMSLEELYSKEHYNFY